MKAVIRQPDGTNLLDLTLTAKIKETETGDFCYSVTGKANVLSGKIQHYDLKFEYKPLTQNLKGRTECGMAIGI